MLPTPKRPPSFIDPTRLYALEGFKRDSGINGTRMREARLQGIELETLEVGRRKFVRGSAGIAYIERLSQLKRRNRVAE